MNLIFFTSFRLNLVLQLNEVVQYFVTCLLNRSDNRSMMDHDGCDQGFIFDNLISWNTSRASGPER